MEAEVSRQVGGLALGDHRVGLGQTKRLSRDTARENLVRVGWGGR